MSSKDPRKISPESSYTKRRRSARVKARMEAEQNVNDASQVLKIPTTKSKSRSALDCGILPSE